MVLRGDYNLNTVLYIFTDPKALKIWNYQFTGWEREDPLLLGTDRFMSEARAITNLIGNSVATVVVAKWGKEIDREGVRPTIGSNYF